MWRHFLRINRGIRQRNDAARRRSWRALPAASRPLGKIAWERSGWVTLGFAIRLSNSDNEPNAAVSLMCFSRASVIALGAAAGGDVDCATTRLADNVAIEVRSKRRFHLRPPFGWTHFAP